jgi:hypothetical protein
VHNLPRYALSIRQPWCYAILNLGKDVEKRSWRSGFRVRVIVHASQAFDPEGLEYLHHAGFVVPEALPRGVYVGEVTVTGCVAAAECQSPWGFGPWCFLLERPVLYSDPVPGKGRLGFYRVPEAVKPGLKEAMP